MASGSNIWHPPSAGSIYEPVESIPFVFPCRVPLKLGLSRIFSGEGAPALLLPYPTVPGRFPISLQLPSTTESPSSYFGSSTGERNLPASAGMAGVGPSSNQPEMGTVTTHSTQQVAPAPITTFSLIHSRGDPSPACLGGEQAGPATISSLPYSTCGGLAPGFSAHQQAVSNGDGAEQSRAKLWLIMITTEQSWYRCEAQFMSLLAASPVCLKSAPVLCILWFSPHYSTSRNPTKFGTERENSAQQPSTAVARNKGK